MRTRALLPASARARVPPPAPVPMIRMSAWCRMDEAILSEGEAVNASIVAGGAGG
jgi:hypothetical protein